MSQLMESIDIKKIYYINLVEFLYGIRKEKENNTEEDILKKLNIDKNNYNKDVQDKIRLYIDYFYEVSRII